MLWKINQEVILVIVIIMNIYNKIEIELKMKKISKLKVILEFLKIIVILIDMK